MRRALSQSKNRNLISKPKKGRGAAPHIPQANRRREFEGGPQAFANLGQAGN